MTLKRFWDKVKKGDSCWEWQAAQDGFGYGRFGFRGCNQRAHRVSWILHFGSVPIGLCVLHKCDNPRCVNPEHLYLGTKKDNARDRERRERGNHASGSRHGCHTHLGMRRGSRNGRAKLDPKKVRSIRKKYEGGVRKIDLARLYDVSDAVINSVVQRKSWSHVD